MAIVGLGTDIVEIERIEKALDRYGSTFANRILTDLETKIYDKSKQKEYFLAKRFAIKEAASKALGMGMAYGVSFHDFGVSNDNNGKPILSLMNKAAETAILLGVVSTHVTISDERRYALATVLFES
ncbi:holo-[acyl-carrier-protein] synthase [Candidatus Photodesmus blepharus]|uniref:Holo-[acyl-carrier-protein] synthase n=1 Tax=Candidatus Photodesmus blepharonis TaxID=1179155 RepID=A0A084CNV2_9GAMM|nr:holo-ACP synthase [Candidatus Photodesmus blepharus]KEY91481.1 holo-[acyl-carrier-protein] synthase [Candidatus Photodesmus blepharus]